MQIKDLSPNKGNVDLVVEAVTVDEPRTFEKFGKEGKVQNVSIKDESGQAKLTLWNEQAETIKEGDKIKITNGYVKEYQGELQISSGKFGKLEVITE